MDAVCVVCGEPIWRQGYGSFVGPWLVLALAGLSLAILAVAQKRRGRR